MAIDGQKIKDRLVKYLSVSFTLLIAIITIVVSVRTVGDLMRTAERRRAIEPKLVELQEKITRDSTFIQNLQHSPEFLEKFAREHFLMQREGDVVYILEEHSTGVAQ
ncbi:MAG: septum formation initiator family protein [Alistipes sp.]|jgi:cell division protein FtsB|nr:septum formation initiator family protein [Alistipes sp.]